MSTPRCLTSHVKRRLTTALPYHPEAARRSRFPPGVMWFGVSFDFKVIWNSHGWGAHTESRGGRGRSERARWQNENPAEGAVTHGTGEDRRPVRQRGAAEEDHRDAAERQTDPGTNDKYVYLPSSFNSVLYTSVLWIKSTETLSVIRIKGALCCFVEEIQISKYHWGVNTSSENIYCFP